MSAPFRPARTAVPPLGPDGAAIVAACIVVGTAAYLGVWWLKSPVLTLPFGVWLILAWYAARRIARRGREAVAPAAFGGAPPSPPDAAEPHQLTLGFAAGAAPVSGPREAGILPLDIPPLTEPGRALLAAAGPVARLSGRVRGERSARLISSLSDWHDRRAWPTLPIRIAAAVAPALAEEFARASRDRSVLWLPVGVFDDPDREALSGGFDAFLWRSGDGRLRLSTPEHDGRDAAWYDWSVTPPFSYASVFPLRIDPARLTLPDLAHPADFVLARLLIETAAILSRTPARLTLGDRLRGRRPLGAGPLGRTDAALDAAAADRLLALLSLIGGAEASPELRRIAARVASAYFAAHDSSSELDARRRGIDAALAVLDGEPEAALRAVAARYAAGDEPEGLRAAALADRLIRAKGLTPIADPLSFLHSEMELGSAGPATFGRVAAGVTLVCATTPDDRFEYLKEDLSEDLRFSTWFVGRDADALALLEILRTLDRTGRPAAKAA